MQFFRVGAAIAAVAILGGCAHPIAIGPDLSKIERPSGSQVIGKNVGYYIPDAARTAEVTTPGGGGDKVSYHPYSDDETAIYKMLSNVFANVVVLKSPSDSTELSKNKIAYIIKPELITNSSSGSALTWPPTHFTVDMTCTVDNPDGQLVVVKKVTGTGDAEFSEFKKDFSLAGRRASEDALKKMQKELAEAPELQK